MIKKITGYWWLPDTPNQKYYGILKIFYSNRSNIELKGLFSDERNRRTKFINTKYILGKSEKGGNITLYNCSEYSRNSTGMSYFYIDMVFVGHHFTKEDDIKFNNIFVEYQFLSNWFITETTLDVNSYENGKKEIIYQPQCSEIVNLKKNDFNFKLQIITRLTGKEKLGLGLGGNSSLEYKECSLIKIKFDDINTLNFNDIKEIILDIQDLLSIIVQTPSYPIIIIGERYIEEKQALNPPIDIYFPLRGEPDTKMGFNFRSTLFYYRDVLGNFEYLFINWFKNTEKLKPMYKLYLTSLYNSGMYLEYKFLSLVQAIEAYHRINYKGVDKYVSEEEYNNILEQLNKKVYDIIVDTFFRSAFHSRLEYGNEYSLRKRFNKLFRDYYIDIFKVSLKKIDYFIEDVVSTRNYLVHQDDKLKDKSFHGEEYFKPITILKTLIEIIVLKELGFKDNQLEKFYQEKIKNNNLNIKL